MRRMILTLFAVALITAPATAQEEETTRSEPSKVYWGGTIGFNFGDYTRYSIAPLVGSHDEDLLDHASQLLDRTSEQRTALPLQ